MDSSRRAVESYWRSRMVDGVTSDEDKVAPVYKLEEICELMRSSHSSIVKEVSGFVLKRLDHKSPIVKQKALRLIKYAVGKSGVEFRREMQRNSVAVRQLFHYKGQPDPFKGDALNKAVRDTAHDAISAIFLEENSKPAPQEDLNRRIQGFGNTNFEMPSEDKKSFLSEVVGIGSASIKQGLSNFAQGQSLTKNDNGNYRSPTLRRSLTSETDYSDRYEPVELPNESRGNFGISKKVGGEPWGRDSRVNMPETETFDSKSGYSDSKTREEKLLDTIVTSGGVRLQPTRDAIHAFLLESAKMDALALSDALALKLQSPLWQVRMKAMCVLESILRKKDDDHLSYVASYFRENIDAVLKCSESPQSSLREKSIKVMGLLNGENSSGFVSNSGNSMKTQPATVVDMPDLIDTGDPGDLGADDSTEKASERNAANLKTTKPLIDDLFGDGLGADITTNEQNNDDDPFADVSFYNSKSKDVNDLFSGTTADESMAASRSHVAANKTEPEMFDFFGSSSELKQEQENPKDVNNLFAGFSIDDATSKMKQKATSLDTVSENIFPASNSNSIHQASNNALGSMLGPQISGGVNANPVFPFAGMPYNIPHGMMLNPSLTPQQIYEGAMGNLLAQQQLLATMSNFQHNGNLNSQSTMGGHNAGTNAANVSALPDIFHQNFPTHSPTSGMNNSKKEETRAFDFITDHLQSARDPKRIV